ncbi:farnesyl pyrophosphate synthase-like [Leptopilina boulardi]|uniref:farnesyl pyrophosphate synthase-like n=1 Tax=Leptopilina boulardi TaxID=63433 RepID=UPI0021F598B9|nr:farnesyl pyrophosphate synthase-like [Leptopilina boulardi]
MSSCIQNCTSLLRNGFPQKLVKNGISKITSNLVRSQSSDKRCFLYPLSVHNNVHMVHTAPQTNWVTSKDESREMMALWPDVVRDLTVGRHTDMPDVTRWLSKVLQYNVPGGKKNRALVLVYAYKQLAHPDQLTDENIRLARILGWCNEMLQAFFLMEDDIVDRSKTRRGQPCWYLHNDIGLAAVNDGILIEQMIYQLLRMHFGDKPYYLDFVNTFHENIYKTTVGQSLDLLSTNHGKKPNLNLFTMDRYNAIVKYKTGYYTFVMPVTLAMHFAGIKDSEMFRQATTILLEIGNFFQVQDDYLDCFGDPQVTGKVGTDIEEGKCSWLVVVALQRVTPAQRKILEECYGVNDPEKVARVKQLYHDLGLQTTYSVYEEENYNLINTHIQQISRGLPHDLFFKILNKIYRRNM